MSDLIRKLNLSRTGNICLGIIVAYLICFIFPISYHAFWTDSEMWSVASARGLFLNSRFMYAMKPIFSGILWLPRLLPYYPNFLPIDAARFLFALNGLVILFLIFYITKVLSRTSWALLAVFICLSTYYFTYRGLQVRSDFLATSFVLLALSYMVRPQDSRKASGLNVWGSLLLAILSTPKAVFLCIALLPFLKKDQIRKGFSRFNLSKRSIAGLLISLVMILIILSQTHFLKGLLNSWNFFLSGFSEEARGFSYLSQESFLYIVDFLRQDSFFVGIFILCVLWSPFYWKQNKNLKIGALVSIILVLNLILYPDKLPFFIASYIPFFCIFICLVLHHASGTNFFQKNTLVFIFLIVLTVGLQVVSSIKNRLDIMNLHNNKEQRLVTTYLTEFYTNKRRMRIFDSVGILQDRSPDYLFVGPASIEETMRIRESIIKNPPDVILMTNKVSLIYPQIADFVAKNYIALEQGIFIRAINLKVSEAEIKNGVKTADLFFTLQPIFLEKWRRPYPLRVQALDKNGQQVGDILYHAYISELQKESLTIPSNTDRLMVTIYRFPLLPVNKRVDELFKFNVL